MQIILDKLIRDDYTKNKVIYHVGVIILYI